MASGYLINVPKLKGRENYDEWAFAAENFLVLEGLAKSIVNAPEASEMEEDRKIKAKLILTVDPSLFVHIKEAKTTKLLWDKLKSMFDDSGFTRRISLLRTLISTRLDNCDSMSAYVNQIVETSQRLRGTGFNIDDEWVGSLLLAGLPERFMPMIMAIEHSGIMITTDSIKTKLLDMDADCTGKAGSALYTRSSSNNRRSAGNSASGKFDRSHGDKSDKQKKEVRCFRCNQLGHFRNKCPLLQKEKDKNTQKPENAFSVVFLNGDYQKSDWYVDSGASRHFVVNESSLTDASSEVEIQNIMVANKTEIPVVSTGNVHLKTIVNKQIHSVNVQNVFCVPDLSTNLLSVSQLIKNGNSVIFDEQCCRIYNQNNDLVAIANLANGVYKLDIVQNPCLLSVSDKATTELWHRRLGHINNHDLEKMESAIVLFVVKVNKLECPSST